MRTEDKEQLLAALADGQKVLLDALANVTEEPAARAPAPDRWSILQCVEHLAVSEAYLLAQVAAAQFSESAVANPAREARILSRGADRTRPMPAPEVGRPPGRCSSLAQAVEQFMETRRRTVQFVEGCHEDLRQQLAVHPLLGPVNSYEMLLMIAVHPKRHAGQIEEIK